MAGKLDGLKIVVPESREIDLLASLLEGEGAVAIRCPLVKIVDVEDFASVDGWIRTLITDGFDDLILFTGEGVRRLARRSETLGLKEEFAHALGSVRTIIRGPKPARALRELGLHPTLAAPSPTSQGLIEAVAGDDLTGRRVGVQVYPGDGFDPLITALKQKGAVVTVVTPYRYASQTETGAVADVITKMAAGAYDMIVFTSSPQVDRLADVARERNIESVLRDGLARTRVAALGPVVEGALKKLGVSPSVVPEGSPHLKPLIKAIVAVMER